ncbi:MULTISPECIES: SDR family oxidoreductase [unclassified Halobacteriovorax]|uniref:SDR family oxidoreductase n=1 Tax=unclassified Halobacteriovorax TaxID=2639665 RepID=UPI0039994A79
MKKIDNKIILITGGYGYLGREISKGLALEGARVIVAGRDVEKFNLYFSNNPEIDFVEMDILDRNSIENAALLIKNKYEYIDGLINNAFSLQGGTVENSTFERGILGSLSSVEIVTDRFLPLLLESSSASIINISSMYGVVAPDFTIYETCKSQESPIAYGAAKAGVIQLTKYYASKLGQKGVRVNSISPGPFPNIENVTDSKFLSELQRKTLLKRVGNPEELIGPCEFLISDSSSFMTGHNLIVDGGWTVC